MLVVELLEHVGLELLVVPDRFEDLLALLVRGRLDKVGDLGRVQSCAAAARRASAARSARGRRTAPVSGQATNCRWSVSWPRNRRGSKRHSRAPEARVDSGHAPDAVLAHQLDLARRDQPGGVDVDQAAVEHVGAQQHLAGPALELRQVELGRRGARRVGAKLLDAVDRDEHLAAADSRQQPDDGRQRISRSSRATTSSDPSETLSGGVQQRTAGDRGDVNDGVGHRSLGEG